MPPADRPDRSSAAGRILFPSSRRELLLGLATALLLPLFALFDHLTSTPYYSAASVTLLAAVGLATVIGRLGAGVLASVVSLALYLQLFRAPAHPHGSLLLFCGFLLLALILAQLVVNSRATRTCALAALAEREWQLERAAAQALQERNSLELALRAGKMTTCEWTPEHGYVWSGSWSAWGYDGHRFDGPLDALLEIVHPDDRERVREARNAITTSETATSFSYRILNAAGDLRWLECHWQSYAEAGVIVRAFGVTADITERVSQEQALLERDEQFQLIAENINEVFWVASADGSFEYASPTFERIWGYEREQFTPTVEAVLHTVHPDDRARVRKDIGKSLRERTETEFRIVRGDGAERWLRSSGFPVCDDAGAPVRIVGLCEDITERRQAQLEAEQAEERLRFLSKASAMLAESLDYEQTLAAIVKVAIPALGDWFIIDLAEPDGSLRRLAVVHGDPAKMDLAERLTAFPPDLGSEEGCARVLKQGSVIYDPVDEDVIEAVSTCAEHARLLRDLGCGAAIQVGLTAHGDTFGVITAMSATAGRYSTDDLRLFENIAGRIALAIANARLYQDAQAALVEHRQTLAELNAILNAAPAGLALFDLDMRYARVNEFLARATGHSIADCLGRRPSEILGVSGRRVEEMLKQVLKTGKPLFDQPGALPSNDESRLYQCAVYPVFTVDGELQGVGIIAADVTEQTQLEQQLRQAQKMKAVGLLAGGIAHDFNNVLTAISVSGDLLESNLPTDSNLRREAGEIQKAAQRASELTRQLLAFSRRQVLQPRPLILNDVVRETETMLRHLLGEQIDFSVALADDLAATMADPSQLEQVIFNLVVNARDALAGSGSLQITTRNVHFAIAQLGTLGEIPAGDYASLEINDSGCGIEPELLEQIFDPFFTTKQTGEGTGLGLATVYGIVSQSDGYVDVDSVAGKGSTFQVLLPAVSAAAAAPSANDRDAVSPGGMGRASETVLFVEDEDAVRLLVRSLLEQLGYTVREAANGLDALDLVNAGEAGEIDILLTDLVMPKMGGRELSEQLRSRCPDLRVLFISGHDDDPQLSDVLTQPHTKFIEKPFTALRISQALRSLLEEER